MYLLQSRRLNWTNQWNYPFFRLIETAFKKNQCLCLRANWDRIARSGEKHEQLQMWEQSDKKLKIFSILAQKMIRYRDLSVWVVPSLKIWWITNEGILQSAYGIHWVSIYPLLPRNYKMNFVSHIECVRKVRSAIIWNDLVILHIDLKTLWKGAKKEIKVVLMIQ